MPADHHARVAELLADYRRTRERLDELQSELAAITGSVRSEDGTVEVTVGPQGVLSELRITDSAYERHEPSRLAEMLVELVGRAAGLAAARAEALLEPVLPAGADPAAVVEGRADLAPRRGEVSGVRDDRSADSTETELDEEDFGERSWLRDSTVKRTRP